MNAKQHYVEIMVGIQRDAKWFKQLRDELRCRGVRWIDNSIAQYHVTVAFMEEIVDSKEVCEVLESFYFHSQVMLDKIEVFTDFSGKNNVISLSSTNVPNEFKNNVNVLRQQLTEIGCIINSDFRFHVTLGIVDAAKMSIEEIRKAIANIPSPDNFSTLEYVRFVQRKGHQVVWSNVESDITYILKNRKVRFISPLGYFDYTTFGNFCFGENGVMYLITNNSQYTYYHKPDVLPFSLWSVVPVIYAGVDTGVSDDTGREIFTGDIVTLDDKFTSLVNYLHWEDEPSLAGDNCDYLFSMSQVSLHVEGTAFSNMTNEMFERFNHGHIYCVTSQFYQNGLSRDEVIRMAKLAFCNPHFVTDLNIISKYSAIYADIEEEMSGNPRIVYIASNVEYENYDGEMVRDIFADNLPKDYDGEYYSIDIVDADTTAGQLKKPFEDFIAYAHSHPALKFILCDFKDSLNYSIRRREIYDIIKPLKTVLDYNIRNIVLPAWIYFDLMEYE
ncbi:MAG: hypothetical protein MJ002_02275 [Paludibacteraceae bacterium]|nr:hypothetical protein [Paludibacteraceae bacterium]